MFDNCKGEKLQELLVSFSTIVLRKNLATGQAGKTSIAGRLALAKRVTSKDCESFLPLAVAHRASLTALLSRKRELKDNYDGFGRTLKSKELELDQRFETVVSTQDFLDQHVIPDHTVSRVSALFEKNWHSDDRMVDVIAQGEEQGLGDSSLDKPFEETWSEVASGRYGEQNGTCRHGLLQDLENRVAEQQARLSQWKEFREAMKRDTKPRVAPNKQDLGLTRITSNDQNLQKRKDRDFVFSPRKSPRKSGWEIEHQADEVSPTPSKPAAADKEEAYSRSLMRQPDSVVNNSPMGKVHESQAQLPVGTMPAHDASLDYSDESGFSEISRGIWHHVEPSDHAVQLSILGASSPSIRPKKSSAQENNDHVLDPVRNTSNGTSATRSKTDRDPADHRDSDTGDDSPVGLPAYGKPEVKIDSKPRDEDDILTEQIISMTINAAPTPAKPKLSLAERTRHSMAFATPSGFQGLTAREASPPPFPSVGARNETKYTDNGAANTLLERTRQSISMLPLKPGASRNSMHNRRKSKIYPTNQFETPKKQLSMVEEATPPEVLFSPGAGYDSVFKSRPRIAVSPTPSPMPGERPDIYDREEGASMQDRADQTQWEESPLARVAAQV